MNRHKPSESQTPGIKKSRRGSWSRKLKLSRVPWPELFAKLNHAGQDIIVVTHNGYNARLAHWITRMRDGHIEFCTKLQVIGLICQCRQTGHLLDSILNTPRGMIVQR